MTLDDDTIETITCALMHYHATRYHLITDYTKVILSREEITVNNTTIYKYPCPCQTIYLDSEHYAVTYDKQHVIDDKYYYDFNPDMEDIAGTYEEIGSYEWKRNSAILDIYATNEEPAEEEE